MTLPFFRSFRGGLHASICDPSIKFSWPQTDSIRNYRKNECRVKDGELWYMVPRGIWYLNTEKPRYCLTFAKIRSQKDKRADDGPRGKNKLNVLRTVWDTSAGIWFILLYSFSEHVLHKESEKSQKMWTRQPTSIETQRKGGHTNDNLCCDNWTLK